MKKKLLIIGKLPPPYMGPSVAFELLINSDLREYFDLYHLDIMANRSLDTLGKFSFSKLGKNLGVYRKFAEQLKTIKPDMVLIPISQTTMGFIKDSAFIWLCRKHRVKCVIQLRGSNFKKWIDGASGPVRSYVSKTLSIPEGVIVLGEKLRYLFEDFFTSDRIFVVPNGGDFPQFTANKNDNGTFTFLYLANLQSSKGIEDIIAATAILKEKTKTPFQVKVAGQWRDPQTKAGCMEIVNSGRLPVEFVNPLKGDEKFRFLADGDAFLFTPREPEGHPWVIIEAMSAGLPVISTDQGAITESVRDGENGFIVPVRDPASIAQKMQELLENPQHTAAMGTASRRLYEEQFTEKRMTARLARVITTLAP